MSEGETTGRIYNTAAMAEILLAQDMLKDAARVIKQLEKEQPGDPRVETLRSRLEERLGKGDPVQTPGTPSGIDQVSLAAERTHLTIQWELTDDGLELARRQVRYSGQSVLRLFTATPGPRGVRTGTRDFDLTCHCGQLQLSGMASPAVYTAAIGFLGRNGAFVPLARALPVSDSE